MNEIQADEMLELMRAMLGELQFVREQLSAFTRHGADDLNDAVERIVGPLGYHLGDLHSKLDDLDGKLALIDINTTP